MLHYLELMKEEVQQLCQRFVKERPCINSILCCCCCCCLLFRDAHFVIGEEDEKKTEEDDNIISDPKYVAFIQLYFVVNNKTT